MSITTTSFVAAIRTAETAIGKASAKRNKAIADAWAAGLHGDGGKSAFASWAVQACEEAGVRLGKSTVYNALRIAEARADFPVLRKADDTVALRVAEDSRRLAESDREAYAVKAANDGIDAAREAFGLKAKVKAAPEAKSAADAVKAAKGAMTTEDAYDAIAAILSRVKPADIDDAHAFASCVAGLVQAYAKGLDPVKA